MSLIIPNRLYSASSRDYAYQVLNYNIIHWQMLPGDVIKDNEIASALNISRTPVREALNFLRDDRLVDVGSITRVALIDPQLVYEGIYIRTAVETLIAEDIHGRLTPEQIGMLRENLERQRLVVEGNIGKKTFFELDNEFHKLFYEFADKLFTYNIVRKACYQQDRVRSWTFIKMPVDLAAIYKRHCEICEAAINGSKEDLKMLNHKHCIETHLKYHDPKIAETLLADHPEYFAEKDFSELDEKLALLLKQLM